MKKIILMLMLTIGLIWFAGAIKGWEYVNNDTLKKDLAEYVDKPIKIRDEVVAIWKNQPYEGYLKFDTVHFSCIIKKEKAKDIEILREAHTLGDVEIAIYGTPKRKDFWNFKNTVEVEHILIEVERIEKSREWKLKELGK